MNILKHLISRVTRHIFVEKHNGQIYKAGGLKPHKKDHRDFQYGQLMGWSFWGTNYSPKNTRLVLPTVSIKDQATDNTCTQASATVQKEKDEGVELSEECLTCWGVVDKVITGNGFSSLREQQQEIQKRGIAEKSLLNKLHGNWADYSGASNLTLDVRQNSDTHKSQSYYICYTRDERLKALDDGHILQGGMDWYSGYNQSGGFSSPWLISKTMGILVGGHAIAMIGYDLNFNGQKVYIFQNSYGADWGDHGKFYVTMDFYDKFGHPTYAQVDIEVSVAEFLNTHQYTFVKGSGPAIYMIWGDKKQPFPDWLTFLSYGGRKDKIETVPDSILNQIDTGDVLEITASEGWGLIKETITPDNLKKAQDYLKLNP